MTVHRFQEAPGIQPRPARERAPWRRRLVEAERGIVQGVRGDSTFFVHFFVGSVVLAAGFVLGLALWQWVAAILALTAVLSAELFCQVLRILCESARPYFPDAVARAQRIATAGVFVTILGAVLTVGLVLGQRLWDVLAQG